MAGESKSNFEFLTKDFEPKTLNDVMFKYKSVITDELEQSLDNVNRVASGKLRQSIRVDIDEEEEKISLSLYMDDYWKFVDKGVDGTQVKHGSPYKFTKKNVDNDAMLSFMKFRGITGKAAKTIKPRKEPIPQSKLNEQTAFLIGRSVAKKGLKPTDFFTDVINEDLKKRMSKDILKALGKDILISFGITNK